MLHFKYTVFNPADYNYDCYIWHCRRKLLRAGRNTRNENEKLEKHPAESFFFKVCSHFCYQQNCRRNYQKPSRKVITTICAPILNRSAVQKVGYRKLGGKLLWKVPLMKGVNA